jgi:hypothetical protein
MRCPFYQAVQVEGPLKEAKGYCTGYLNGKLRIPSIYEEMSLCLTRNYPDCQVFKTRMKEEEKNDLIVHNETNIETKATTQV